MTKVNEYFADAPSDGLPIINNPIFVHLYDDKGNKLNVLLVSKPFGTDSDYKLYLDNINKYIYLGISSYMEFPGLPTNPVDKYVLETSTIQSHNSMNVYNLGMYHKLAEGWLHCFKEPEKYLPSNTKNFLLSESDFVNYNILSPDVNVVKQYDFLYNCPKVNESSPCDDWVSYNKNWELAYKCLPILCKKFGLKGLLVGRKNCTLPEGCAQYLDTTGWLDYHEHIKIYDKCKFIFMPNIRDASPRVLTEALSKGLPCLVNRNIIGGWKYVDEEKTGTFFTDENDVSDAIAKLLANMNKYNPRQYIIDNYGPINAGRRLKEYLFTNFKDRLNLKEEDVEHISIRNTAIGFIELPKSTMS
jgi:hypothetical protein